MSLWPTEASSTGAARPSAAAQHSQVPARKRSVVTYGAHPLIDAALNDAKGPHCLRARAASTKVTSAAVAIPEMHLRPSKARAAPNSNARAARHVLLPTHHRVSDIRDARNSSP